MFSTKAVCALGQKENAKYEGRYSIEKNKTQSLPESP